MRLTLAELPPKFDLLVVGGGITGAGIFQEAARRGLRVLLVDRGDFASGTSSWSSKLVHGGLRYLKSGQWRLTLESVRERNRLLRERGGLVEPQPFLMPVYAGQKPGLALLRTGLAVYDVMGGGRSSRRLDAAAALALEPALRRDGMLGAVVYDDARTDDARLTLALILEARAANAVALNYCEAVEVLRTDDRVHGLRLRDVVDGSEREIEAGVVINAAGIDAGGLAGAPAGAPLLRPLRGSHLIFPLARLPVGRAVSWLHPRDRRPVFVYPWEGVALVGTTDVDHRPGSVLRITREEAGYLMEALEAVFPGQVPPLSAAIASTAGVRPVVAGGKADPSAESRESALWTAPGWVGVTGGKLTTFRVTALQALDAASRQRAIPGPAKIVAASTRDRDTARYGSGFGSWLAALSGAAEHEAIPGTPYRWCELRWAARREQVVHLDDLLMRRLRLSLLLGPAVEPLLDRIGGICREELGWDAARWQQERERYRQRWSALHAMPEP